MLVPLVAFNSSKYRIGFGKGFYDRFFSRHPNANNILKIGLAYDGQHFKDLDVAPDVFDAHDWPLDYIVTETQIYE